MSYEEKTDEELSNEINAISKTLWRYQEAEKNNDVDFDVPIEDMEKRYRDLLEEYERRIKENRNLMRFIRFY